MLRKEIPARSTEAFTIIEVALAASVMLLGIVGMFQVIISGTEMIDVSRKQTIAAEIIHSEIDRLHLSDWTTVNAMAASSTIQIDTLSSSSTFGYPELTTFQSVTKGFSVTRTITTVKTDLKKITFSVTWSGVALIGSDSNRTARTYTRTGWTYFGKNGLYVTYQRT
jgi:hypothetical protein